MAQAFQFYKAVTSSYWFKYDYNLQILPDEDKYDRKVYISINELPEVINFISSQIIPSLQALPLSWNAIKTWNVGSSFEAFLGSKGDFFVNFGIDEIDLDEWDKDNLLYIFQRLEEIFEFAVSRCAKSPDCEQITQTPEHRFVNPCFKQPNFLIIFSLVAFMLKILTA